MIDTRDYAFIDGAYLRHAYQDTMQKFFTDVHADNLDLPAIKTLLGASKVFYYDAVDETKPDAKDRQAYLDQIRRLEGFHVRQGNISAAKKQKRVDVQLAVECLMHAFNKNIWHASLIAGDLDFEPLVTALVNVGTHVHVWYEPCSAARGLYHAADVAVPLTIDYFWQWSQQDYCNSHPRPLTTGNVSCSGEFLRARGVWGQRPIELYERKRDGQFVLYAPLHKLKQSLEMTFEDRQKLEHYFKLTYGAIQLTDV